MLKFTVGLKGPSGTSSNQIVRLSVRLFVRLSVIPSHLQYLKFKWRGLYSNQAWTKSIYGFFTHH